VNEKTPGRGVLHAEGLTRSFASVRAVQPLSVTIGPGGITGLLGPNGSGKSTFLRMLIGLVRPDAGHAVVDGATLRGDGTEIRERVTYMPGELRPYGELSGLAHLRWLVQGRDEGALERALGIATRLDLPLERKVHGYSHGMKRQLFFSAAMAPQVHVRILDEPTEGLDPTRRREVLEILKEDVRSNGTTVLLSSHHLGEVDRACERILFLRMGELLDENAAGEIHRRAKRAMRLQFEGELEDHALTAVLRALGTTAGVELGEGTAARITLFLAPDADPRETLARIFALREVRELPEPASLVYGELSLHELYRELYGSEGV